MKKKTDDINKEAEQSAQSETAEETVNAVETEEISETESLKKELAEANDKVLRIYAEFDNYKKRTLKQNEANHNETVASTVKEFLPVLDNLSRALESSGDTDSPLAKGVLMIKNQFEDVFAKIGVEEIKALGEKFNPDIHNAVMHIEDDETDENTIVEEFEKGYKFKDKVIRYSAVKVAN